MIAPALSRCPAMLAPMTPVPMNAILLPDTFMVISCCRSSGEFVAEASEHGDAVGLVGGVLDACRRKAVDDPEYA